jgi:tetratricopeptide (TPR) repeat protein
MKTRVEMLKELGVSSEDAEQYIPLGKVRIERGDADGAEPLIRESLELRRSVFGNEHPTVANALDGTGELMQAKGDHAAAERAFREAPSVRRALFPPEHADIGVSFQNIGIALHARGRRAEAAAVLDSALAILRPVFGDEHRLARVTRVYRDSAAR